MELGDFSGVSRGGGILCQPLAQPELHVAFFCRLLLGHVAVCACLLTPGKLALGHVHAACPSLQREVGHFTYQGGGPLVCRQQKLDATSGSGSRCFFCCWPRLHSISGQTLKGDALQRGNQPAQAAYWPQLLAWPVSPTPSV